MKKMEQFSNTNREYSDIDDFEPTQAVIEELIKSQQTRKTILHIVTHSIAYIILVPFALIIIYNTLTNTTQPIPTYFISIVSIVIGFYFGGKVLQKKS
ncbi:hypothetical protein HQ545_02495 [Candidatus Woesearchaeota archaeon]|nr:hypothetical protein [Candidatus Woesearchaeota archaeon]